MGMPRRTNLRGISTDGQMKHTRFEKLVATGDSRTNEQGQVEWELICNCGNIIWLTKSQLRKWMDRYPYIPFNCGCYTEIYLKQAIEQASQSEIHRLRLIYNEMVDFCDPKSKNYKGTTICDQWADKKTGYSTFVEWAYRDGYYMEQPEDTKPEDLWRFYKKATDSCYSPISCDFREPIKRKEEKVIEHHILFVGIEYEFSFFAKMVGITMEELTTHINNRTLYLVVHNFFHPEDIFTLDENNIPRDKNGNHRLIRKYDISVLD